MNQSTLASIIVLAATGLASAIACVLLGLQAFGVLAPGVAFGVALLVYFALSEENTTLLRSSLFICACSAAYPLAMFAAIATDEGLRPPGTDAFGATDIAALPLLVGGSVGAFIVMMTALVLFAGVPLSASALGAILLGSLGAGLLALVGQEAGHLLSPVGSAGLACIFVAWQSGSAAILGLLLAWIRKSALERSTDSERPVVESSVVGIASKLLFGSVLAAFGFFVIRTIQTQLEERRLSAVYKTLRAESPSRSGLRTPIPVAPDSLCLMQDIAGLHATAANSGDWSSVPLRPPLAQVSSCYYGPSDPSDRPEREAVVEVVLLPNTDWARYAVKYAVVNLSASCPRCVTTLPVRGQHLERIADSSFYPLHYLWASGSFAIFIRYRSTQNTQEFLDPYLSKYPSDL